MGVLTGILLIVLGLLAASSFITRHSRDAGAAIETLRPVQGWVGIVGCLAGVGLLLQVLFAVGGKAGAAGFGTMLVSFLAPLLMAALGFLMGFSMISGMVASNAEARQQANELYAKLSAYQIPIGLLAVPIGVWRLFT